MFQAKCDYDVQTDKWMVERGKGTLAPIWELFLILAEEDKFQIEWVLLKEEIGHKGNVPVTLGGGSCTKSNV